MAAPGDARGHALMMVHARSDTGLEVIRSEGAPGTLLGGPFRGEPACVLHARTDPEFTGPALLPVVVEIDSGRIVADDALEIARTLAPDLFPDRPEHEEWVARIAERLVDGALALGLMTSQAAYEAAFARFEEELRAVEAHLTQRRYLLGREVTFADYLLFAFCARLDPVYFPLYKANPCCTSAPRSTRRPTSTRSSPITTSLTASSTPRASFRGAVGPISTRLTSAPTSTRIARSRRTKSGRARAASGCAASRGTAT